MRWFYASLRECPLIQLKETFSHLKKKKKTQTFEYLKAEFLGRFVIQEWMNEVSSFTIELQKLILRISA